MALIRRVPPVTRPGPDIRRTADEAAAREKARLRPIFRQARDAVAGEERAAAEAEILDTLFSSPLFRRAEAVCAYLPLPGEIDLYPLWRRAYALGKTFLLPCTDPDRGGSLTFRVLPGYDTSLLVPGPFGTLEPGPDCPPAAPRGLCGALMLVPGLAFDDEGYRLGYGGGYYDRFLRETCGKGCCPVTVGLAFEACCAEALPRTSHDMPVCCVLSERRLTITHADYTRFETRL